MKRILLPSLLFACLGWNAVLLVGPEETETISLPPFFTTFEPSSAET